MNFPKHINFGGDCFKTYCGRVALSLDTEVVVALRYGVTDGCDACVHPLMSSFDPWPLTTRTFN